MLMVGESNAPAAEISKSTHKTLFVLVLFMIFIPVGIAHSSLLILTVKDRPDPQGNVRNAPMEIVLCFPASGLSGSS